MKFINILKNVISEQKRYRFQPEVYEKIHSVVDNLWNDRKKEYKGKTTVDTIPFKLADGTDGLVRVVVNPRLPYIGFMGTKPKTSSDPADIFIEVNPKHYESKKNLYLTVYHEMIHASDPTQTHKFSPKYMLTYDEKSDEKYWGHPIEFFAITNEFLEGLVLEFRRRLDRYSKPENIKTQKKILDNIMDYFAKGKPLTKQSLYLLQRINDENIGDTKMSQVLASFQEEHPELSNLIPPTYDQDPYYLHYVQMIKRFNPKIWPRFLTMLYKTKLEIEDMIKEKRGLN